MKYLTLITILFFTCCSGCSQNQKKVTTPAKEKHFVWPKELKDSIWQQVTCDTTFGTLEITAGNGKIIAKGYVTCCLSFEYHKHIYSNKDQKTIDSMQKADSIWVMNGGGFAIGPCYSTAFIKTSTGYKRVDQPFILKP